MAEIEFSGLEELMGKVTALDDGIDDLIDDALMTGAGIAKSSIETAIFRQGYNDSGDLIRSIKVKRKKDRYGSRCVIVTPTGKDGKGSSNGEKAFVLNYGRSYTNKNKGN